MRQAGTFSITHYAGKVFYTAEGFVMKNTDTMQEDMTNLMLSCEGLGLIKPALQAKADLEAGKDPTKKEEAPKEETPKEEAKAPAKMSMAERMAALQKNNQPDPPKGPVGGGRGKIKKKEPPPTLGGRLRSGIGEVTP